MAHITWQREYFALAAVWLSCRSDQLARDGDPTWRLLGELDYHSEMTLLLQEVKSSLPR